MRCILILTALTLLNACAAKNVRVSCDGRLLPINPKPIVSAASHAPPADTAPREPPSAEATP